MNKNSMNSSVLFLKEIRKKNRFDLILSSSTNENISMEQSPNDVLQWNLGDVCLCPYSEDGILYKATIIDLHPPNCTVMFDDYGNEETHLIIELKIRNEKETSSLIEQTDIPIQENDPLILLNFNRNDNQSIIPPFNFNDNSNDLSETLMSWYLAGYHTGFYQAIRQRRN